MRVLSTTLTVYARTPRSLPETFAAILDLCDQEGIDPAGVSVSISPVRAHLADGPEDGFDVTICGGVG